MAAVSLSCLSHASLRQAALRASASTNDSVLSGASSAKLLLPSLPFFPKLLLTQLPWPAELCPPHMGLELHKAELEPPESLRGIPDSAPSTIQEGISTTGQSPYPVQGTQHFSLLTPYVTDPLLVPSAKWSLTSTADDNFLPKTLVPKDGFIEENLVQSEFFFSPEQQRKMWVFSVISFLTPQTPEQAAEAPCGPGHTKGMDTQKTEALLSPGFTQEGTKPQPSTNQAVCAQFPGLLP